jgi:hypothetical protein
MQKNWVKKLYNKSVGADWQGFVSVVAEVIGSHSTGTL